MVKVENLGYIKGVTPKGCYLGRCYAPFDEQLNLLKNSGAEFPYLFSLNQAINLRLESIYTEGMRTCHANLQLKGEDDIVIARISPLIKNPEMAKQAVQAHINGNCFFTEDSQMYADFHSCRKETLTDFSL